MKKLETRVTDRFELGVILEVRDASDRGDLLLAGRKGIALLRPGAAPDLRPSGDEVVVGAALSAEGRVGQLLVKPSDDAEWPARLSIAEPTEEFRSFDANLTGSLAYCYGTGGDVAWAGEDGLWLAGTDESDDHGLWVGLADAGTGALIHGSGFTDPYAESTIELDRRPERDRCLFGVHAGQHGSWLFEASQSDDQARISVTRLLDGSEVWSHAERGDELWTTEASCIVRRSSKRAVIGSAEIPEEELAVGVLPGPAGLAVVVRDIGWPLLFDMDEMRFVGVLEIEGVSDRSGARTIRVGPTSFATSVTRSLMKDPRTEVAFWELPANVG